MKKRIWAIADLHLGFSTGKWMDPFGDHWKGHHLKVETNWKRRIAAQDLVLLPGDFSWAMRPDQVAQEFEWLSRLPGKKVLIKGNHDYWWPGTKKKLRELLPADTFAMKKTALVVDGVPLVGVRGCDLEPSGAESREDHEATVERELGELRASIEHLLQIEPGTPPRVALFHYPPFASGERESVFTEAIERTGCRDVVYGHLHTEGEWKRFFQGEHNGVRYHLVACDALGFDPLLIDEWESDVEEAATVGEE